MTAATFGFYAKSKWTPYTTLYMPYCGNESGAARALLMAVKHALEHHHSLSFTVTDFIRADEYTELTTDHDAYTNTAYRYEIVTQEEVEAPSWKSGRKPYSLDDTIECSCRIDYYDDRPDSFTVKSYTIRELIAKYYGAPLNDLEEKAAMKRVV